MDKEIVTAVLVFRNSPQLSDEDLWRVLVKTGVENKLAARLVEFLPPAYFRVILESTGASFPDSFQRKLADGTLTGEIPLGTEPVWIAALGFARTEIGRGVTLDDRFRLAVRSAHFMAANDLLLRGSRFQNIVFTPQICPWPEEGPEF